MKTSPLRREAVYYLYAYRTIKSELMAPSVAQTPEQDADDIEAAVFGQAHEGIAVKTSGISDPAHSYGTDQWQGIPNHNRCERPGVGGSDRKRLGGLTDK